MNKPTIPTILGIFVLIIALVSGVVIIKGNEIFKSGASANLNPIDVRITNVRDTSFTVSWYTTTPTIGFVSYSDGNTSQTGPSEMTTTHLINVTNLKPNTNYTVSVNSGGTFFDEGQTMTLSSYLVSEEIISGTILSSSGVPAKNALVYIADSGNIKWATITSMSGAWIVSLPTLSDNTLLQVVVQGSDGQTASAILNLKASNPAPDITLGNSYDFRNEETKQATDTPHVPITLPLTP